jgi:hypothetical protein
MLFILMKSVRRIEHPSLGSLSTGEFAAVHHQPPSQPNTSCASSRSQPSDLDPSAQIDPALSQTGMVPVNQSLSLAVLR